MKGSERPYQQPPGFPVPRGPNIADEWPVWRVAIALRLDIVQIDATWSLSDVLDANEALDVLDDQQAMHHAIRAEKAKLAQQVASLTK